jgi:hypothetical protein
VVGDELFWGNDRLEQAIKYALQRSTDSDREAGVTGTFDQDH